MNTEQEKMADMQEDVVMDYTDHFYDNLDEYDADNSKKNRTVQLVLNADGEMAGIRERVESSSTAPY